MHEWGGVAIILLAYVVGGYFQKRQIERFKRDLDDKLTALRFATLERRLDRIEARLIEL